jgi:ribosomal protein L37E
MAGPRDDEPDLDEGLHPEGPSANDLNRFGDEMTTCRQCGHRFYDQAEICPNCGTPVGSERSATPVWIIATVILVLIGIALVWVF